LLGALSLFDKPSLTVGEKQLTINGNGSELNYVYGDPSMLVFPTPGGPDKRRLGILPSSTNP
jgi:hypothetical protein